MREQAGDGDRIHRNAKGVVVAVTYQGCRYDIPPMREEDYREVEQVLASRRQDPLAAIRPQLERLGNDPRLVDMLVDRAYRDLRKPADVPSRQEIGEWLDTREGAIHSLWLMLRRERPDLTLPQVEALFTAVNTAEMLRSRDVATFPEAPPKDAPPAEGVTGSRLA